MGLLKSNFMSDFLSFVGIIGTLAMGTVSPGPSFVLVARTTVAKSRPHGLAAALGMGVGGVLFAVAALLGIQSVLAAAPSFYATFKLLGGLYLCYLGFRIFRNANTPLDAQTAESTPGGSIIRSFLIGLGTQVSNPKTAIVYASVFAAFLPSSISILLGLSVVCAVFLVEVSWYSIVAVALATAKPRQAYLDYKVWIDRVAGAAIGALGAKLVFSAGNTSP